MTFAINLLFLCCCVAQMCAVTKETQFTQTNIAQVYFTLNTTSPEFYSNKQLVGNSTLKPTFCTHLFNYEEFMKNEDIRGRILCKPCDPYWVTLASYGVGLVQKMATLCLVLCGVLGILFISVLFSAERIN